MRERVRFFRLRIMSVPFFPSQQIVVNYLTGVCLALIVKYRTLGYLADVARPRSVEQSPRLTEERRIN